MWGYKKGNLEKLASPVKDSGTCSAGYGKQEGDMDNQCSKQNILVNPWTPENLLHWTS